FFFFFSSRRRHTIFSRDWSSDVCSSDLANKPGQPQVWDTAPNNTCFDWEIGDKAATDALFAQAAHVTKLTVVNNRIVVNSMEGRSEERRVGKECIGQ